MADFCNWSSALLKDFDSSLQHGVSVNDNSHRRILYSNQYPSWIKRSIAQTITVDSIVPKVRPSSSIKFFYPTKVSNKRAKYSMESNAVPNEHEFVRSDTKIPISSKPALSNLANSFRYIPEESCDSVVSIDDVDDDEEEEDLTDAPGKPLNKLVQGPSPARGSKSQEPSAVEELQALMLSVGESSGGAKENLEKAPDGPRMCKVEASMEIDVQKDKGSVTVPNLEMVEEPEESYRARYESEGCRGPIRGVSENGFPTIRVNGYSGSVLMTVYLVTECGEPHLHSITGPGSTKTVCNEVTLEGNISAIQTVIGPEQNMTAVWDSLSVRRIRNWDADKKLRDRGDNPAAWKTKKKEARLMFQCNIPQVGERPGYILTCQSRPFMCTAPSGNPEIWWISDSECSPKGGKEIGIIGKKFSTGFRVRFFGTDPEGLWEAYAEVDKSKSHQGAVVLKVPPYKNTEIDKKVEVLIEVRVGPEKDKRCSESIAFCFKPEEGTKAQGEGPCSYCNSVKNALSHLFGQESKGVEKTEKSDSEISEPESKRPSPHIDELITQKEKLDRSQKRETDSGSFAVTTNYDGDVQMSDLTKKPIGQLKRSTDKRTEVASVGQTPFTGTVTASVPSAYFPPSNVQTTNNSSLLKFVLQNQAVPETASVVPAAFTSTVSNPVAFMSALSGLSVSVAVPSQSSVPVQVYTSPILNTNQLIHATQTKAHAASVGLNQSANVTFLPADLAKTSQPSVQFVVNNQPPLQHGQALSSASIFSPGVPAQHFSTVQLSNSSVATNGSSTVPLGSLKGPGYLIIDSVPQVSIKEEETQKPCDQSANCNPQLPQLPSGSVSSLSSLTAGLAYQSPELVKAASSSMSTVLLVSQGQATSVPQYVPVSKPNMDSVLGIYPIQNLQQQQPIVAQPQQQLQQTQQRMQQPQQQMQQQQIFHQQHQQQYRQQNVEQKDMHTQVPMNITPVSGNFVGSIAHSVTQLPSTVCVASEAVVMAQNIEPIQTQRSFNISTSSTTSPSYVVQHSAQQPQHSTAYQTVNEQHGVFDSVLANSVSTVVSTAQTSYQQTVSPFEGVHMSSNLQFESSTPFAFSDSSIMSNDRETSFVDVGQGKEQPKSAKEPGKVGENVLAHDLNRLSVEGSYIHDPTKVLSKPRDIPVNTRIYANEFSSQSIAMNDPQPMSLTDDTLPVDLSDLIKESNRSDAAASIQYNSNQTNIVSKIDEGSGLSHSASIDQQSHVFNSGLEQQQGQHRQQHELQKQQEKQQEEQLVDSFLVPQLQQNHMGNEARPTDSVNAFIVGEDFMLNGSSFASIDNEPKNSSSWGQVTGHSNHNSSAEMNSSNWIQQQQQQQANANQGQGISNSSTIVTSVPDGSGFATTYSGQQSNSSVYANSSGSDFQPSGSSSISQQQQFTVQSPEMHSDEIQNDSIQKSQHGANIVPQSTSAGIAHAQNHTTLGMENHVAQQHQQHQQQQQQQQQSFFGNQPYVNSMAHTENQLCYSSPVSNSAKLGTAYNTDAASVLHSQMGLQEVLHQTPMNVNQSLAHQSVNESLSVHGSSHGMISTTGTVEQSDISALKQSLLEDLNALRTQGLLSESEHFALCKFADQKNHLLLQVYRSSKHGGYPGIIETLRHFVKDVS